MKVILHADDFGFNQDTLDATIECFKLGALSSCSIMANCESSKAAFDFARRNPQFSYGVHLVYVDNLKPILAPDKIPSLVNDQGTFLPSNDVRKAALLHKLSIKQIIAESQAQIDLVKSAGIDLTHLDSHGHLHKFPSISGAFKQLNINGLPIRRVRGVQNIFIKQPSKTSPNYWLNKYFKHNLSRNFHNPDYFYMSAHNMDIGWADSILSIMNRLPDNATIEIGIHPGKSERWRQYEFADIIDFSTKLRQEGIHKIISWKDI